MRCGCVSGRSRCCPSSMSTTSPTAFPASFRTASRSGSPWRERSCPSPSCCSSTSRRPGCPATRCGSSESSSAPSAAGCPSCSSSTTWTSSWRSVTASSCSTSGVGSRPALPTRSATTPRCSRPTSVSRSRRRAERLATMLQIDEVVTTYGPVRALNGVSFEVPDATITAVLGANGAGKTTLLRTINGLVRARSGRIVYDGHDLRRTPVERVVQLGVAHVPEGRGVITELTVEENLRLGALWRRDRREMQTSMAEMFDLFPPLAERRARSVDTLSGGERQMLAVARALMSRPKLLLLDEPSLGLAPRVTAQIMASLRTLRDEQSITVVLVEQNARSALSVPDQAIVLNLGRVVAAGAAAELAADEKLRHAYLGF